MAATATRLDGGVGGGSSTNRDSNDDNADGDHHHCRRSRLCRVVKAVVMMTIMGKRGGEATAR